MWLASVTLDVSHPDMSPSKAAAPWNASAMSVTAEVFHADMSPSKAAAFLNMRVTSCTRDRSGASAALYSMAEAPLNESAIELHDVLPHCTSAVSFAALVELPAMNLWKSPDTDTLYEPGLAYAWAALPDWTVLVPSPHITVYVPVWPPALISMAWLAAVVFHVVVKWCDPGRSGVTPMFWSAAAPMALPAISLTAPASMSSWGDGMAFTAVLFAALRANASELVPFADMVPSDMVTPPAAWPAFLTWNFDATCFEESSGSLNAMFSAPVAASYAADANAGFVTSRTVMVLLEAAAMVLPAVSLTAPASMYSRGAAIMPAEFRSVELRLNARKDVPLTAIVPLDSVMPPVAWLMSRTWNFEATCFVGSSASLNVMFSAPVSFLYAADDTVGRTMSAVICSAAALFVPKRPPPAPILTEYAALLGALVMLNVPPDMAKRELSASPAPLTSEYAGFCPRRTAFWAATPPTVRLSRFSTVLSGAIYHGPRFWLKDAAPSNMEVIEIAAETSHPDMSPLKAVALANMWFMLVTAEVFHVEMSPLKAAAPANMLFIRVAAETSHAERSPLKAAAPANMATMSVTEEVFHAERSPLKAAFLNMPPMTVTEEVFHVEMSPLKAAAP